MHFSAVRRSAYQIAALRTTTSAADKIAQLPAILKECARISAVNEGRQIHCLILKHGFHANKILMTSLLHMYSKCTYINHSRQVFDEMPHKDIITTNVMISGFFRCNFTHDAMNLFQNMPEKDVGSWNSVITGFGQNSMGRTALFFFEKMRTEGVQFDFMTILSLLSVCADLAASVNGKKVHGLVIKHGFDQHLPIGNAIIDMYAKSGVMEDACLCFEKMCFKNVISWTCLIVGYGKHGLGLQAIQAFNQMEKEGVVPNKITFLGTIYACSHSRLVQEGFRIYNIMIHKYSIEPMQEHYTSMVDLLARSGRVEDAYNFIERMPVKPDSKLLTAFFSSCFSYKNVELAKNVGLKLIELEPEEAGAYMLLSNFYGLIGDLKSVAKVRKLMLDKGIRKEKARTWIEVDRKVHEFESGDKSHYECEKIYSYLENLVEKMKRNGYVTNTSMVMQNVDEDRKEEIVLCHSEKLAIVFGLISTPPATCITIVKNLRVCQDCHVATALISKIEDREIIARDSNRFHHFKDGICSCNNHW